VGEQCDDRIDVAALPGVHEAVDELADAPIPERLQGGPLAACGESRVDGLVRAPERGVDRRGRHLERRRRLLGREPEHVSQDQDGALFGWDLLQGCDERELDALALLIAGDGGGELVLELGPCTRVRPEPDGLDEWLRAGRVRVGRGAVVDRKDALGTALDGLQTGVGGDRVQPGLE
jgi:hypothetical protein